MPQAIDLSLEKPNLFESATIRLTSPMLHIGSEVQRLSPFEYVATPQFVYQPNPEALARSLPKLDLQDYLTAIAEQKPILPILKRVFGEDWASVKDAEGRPIFPKATRSLCWADHRAISNLRPMIRNAYGQPYIPGSSIKGAIRTAIAYHMLPRSASFRVIPPAQRSAIEERLWEKIERYKTYKKASPSDQRSMEDPFSEKNKKEIAKDWMKNLFQTYNLDYRIDGKQQMHGKADDVNRDFMRAIHVSDSQPLLTPKTGNHNQRIATEVIVVSRDEQGKAKYRSSIYTEVIKNVTTKFTLSLDTTMLQWFQHQQGMKLPFHNLDELIALCADFAQAQWECELDYWETIRNNPRASDIRHQTVDLNVDFLREEFYSGEACPYTLRVGWGCGLPGTTLHLLFPEGLASELRDCCHPRNAAPGHDAPKSRRVVTNRDRELIATLGWTKFEIIKRVLPTAT